MCNLVNLHIERFELGKILAEKYNTTVKLKNDGKCAGYAEHLYGSIKGYDDAIFLCLGTGIGSAAFMNGKLLEPHKNPGFEFGHMIIDRNGRQCNCGNKGCWERYASMKHFKADAIEQLKLPKDMLPEEVQAYIRQNKDTEEVSKFLNTYLDYVAIGVTNIINILEPQVVCFGGSFSYYEDVFLPILNQKVKELAFNKNSETKLVIAKLKTDAGIIGAAEI
jgi:glucokinase